MEYDTKPAEQLEVVVEDIPNLVDAGMEIGYHDDLVEHLVMDDPIVVGVELCVVGHLVVRLEIYGVVSSTCFNGDHHVADDVELIFDGVDSLVINVNEDFLMMHYV